jgi:type IV secretory pathway VirB6-like protein
MHRPWRSAWRQEIIVFATKGSPEAPPSNFVTFAEFGLKQIQTPTSKPSKGGDTVKNTLKILVVALMTLAFSGTSFAQAKPATPATPATPASPAMEKKAGDKAEKTGKKAPKKAKAKKSRRKKSKAKKSTKAAEKTEEKAGTK